MALSRLHGGRSAGPASAEHAVSTRLAVLMIAATLALITVGAAAHVSSAVAASGGESEAGATESAHWVQKKIRFSYLGFTTHYSCQGLRDQVRDVLLQLGARPTGLNVHEIGCTRALGRPEPAPEVGGTFFVLEPAPASMQHPIEANWRRVNVRVGTGGLDTAGQCELVDQVRHQILPLFTTRNVKFQQDCIPHQLTLKGSSLSVEVLKPTRAH